jgi:dihydroorotase
MWYDFAGLGDATSRSPNPGTTRNGNEGSRCLSVRTRLPGLADVHVHLRVPGGEHKEDVRSGTAAALAGGFTTILAMPNTAPPIVTLSDLRAAQRQAQAEALCDVHYFVGASAATTPVWAELGREAVGMKIYMDQTYGPLRVSDLTSLMRTFCHWPREKPIALHAEGTSIAIGLGLAAAYGRSIHICHVSRESEITLIAEAKRRGLPVTCEVTPHHLFLSEDDLPRLGPLGDMRPTLAPRADVEALWSHLATTVDCVATDHAPHTLDEKMGDSAPPGVPGLETALPLMLTAVVEGRLTMARLVELMAINPRRIYGLPEQPDTWIEVDIGTTSVIETEGLHTKCGWSPFSGAQVRGRLRRVQYRGALAFVDGEIMRPQSGAY